ncbi:MULTISPECIES: ZIP family metal transporter [unclassified Variovorax]|uniref:ZIP family metal transporter n=1 Tax=unclassified Variovorax TaxID=663243 RepID=UPI0008383108|nr:MULTISPECIES: ZIP family metal transporter [unclassified Variovorax]PNG55653.1 Zinc transporter ZupT [Variovorax sp. B4]PNG57077.1 Zinc transporter ZupT [Variovorax sp. B2]VTV10623.1 zinc transporter ZupT [Variovorax sp. WDL1]
MNLFAIIAATLVAGIGSVWIAALLLRVGVRGGGGVGPQHLLSLAAGALLATAFMHLLPEAFESRIEPGLLFGVLLGGLVMFFLLDKAELWHHGHEHHQGEEEHHDHGPGRAHSHGHDHPHKGGGWAVLTGDSVHCFGDGILIASAFVADLRLGLVAALAVLAHEVPHHIGDLIVLRQSSPNARAALVKVSLAGTMTAMGGLAGWWLVDQLHGLLPYFLVLASSSFVYVALADLIPQLQKRLSARETALQIAWLAVGLLLVMGVSRLAHGEHGHAHEPAEPAHEEHGHRH